MVGLLAFNSKGSGPYSHGAAGATYRFSFGCIALLLLWMAYYRTWRMKPVKNPERKPLKDAEGSIGTEQGLKAHEAVSLLAVLSCAVLCCAVLCCAVLCCAVLCCAVLCCAVLCCAVLCCAVLCCAVLCCAVLCCAVLCCAVLCCVLLCCAVLCCASQRQLIRLCPLGSMHSRVILLPSLYAC